MKKVCIIGLGYIGLPTAAVLADHGYFIHGVDINEKAIKKINKGETHIYEPNLNEKVKNAVKQGLLMASQTPTHSDVFILAVPTPFKENHKPDLSYVKAATKSIAPFISPSNLIILESTSPVGTTEKIVEWIKEERPDLSFGNIDSEQVFVAHCPERVLPGKILEELTSNDRVVGGINEASTEKAAEFYSTFVKGQILKTNARTAEMSKLTENTYRDINIAFANELSVICDKLGIDVWELIELANHHPRVNILQPGPGVGGHCIAVDPWFIVDSAPEEAKLIHTARIVNDSKPKNVVGKVKMAITGMDDPKIACLGLSFKANIDDLRESPAIEVVKSLATIIKEKVYIAEPYIDELPVNLSDYNVELLKTEEAIKIADVIVLLVDHDYFKSIDEYSLQNKIVVDTRGLYRKNKKLQYVKNKG